MCLEMIDIEVPCLLSEGLTMAVDFLKESVKSVACMYVPELDSYRRVWPVAVGSCESFLNCNSPIFPLLNMHCIVTFFL